MHTLGIIRPSTRNTTAPVPLASMAAGLPISSAATCFPSYTLPSAYLSHPRYLPLPCMPLFCGAVDVLECNNLAVHARKSGLAGQIG